MTLLSHFNKMTQTQARKIQKKYAEREIVKSRNIKNQFLVERISKKFIEDDDDACEDIWYPEYLKRERAYDPNY